MAEPARGFGKRKGTQKAVRWARRAIFVSPCCTGALQFRCSGLSRKSASDSTARSQSLRLHSGGAVHFHTDGVILDIKG